MTRAPQGPLDLHRLTDQIHRNIKMIKRQMFGRAGLPLLRKRVLLTAQR